jgi:hypothetical protein
MTLVLPTLMPMWPLTDMSSLDRRFSKLKLLAAALPEGPDDVLGLEAMTGAGGDAVRRTRAGGLAVLGVVDVDLGGGGGSGRSR